MKEKKKGQITVFIILGLVLLFIFIFLYMLTREVRIGGLEKAEEEVMGRTFGKEALRLEMEDCLKDGLREGLLKVGEHGGKILDDGGGTDVFLESMGRNYLGDNVFYAITKGAYFPDSQYPCKKGEEPDFCKYKYPNSSTEPAYSIKFGRMELNMKGIEKELEKFVIKEITRCVEDRIKETVPGAELSAENLELELEILNDGIKAEVNYPLKFKVAGEEFFRLAEFDFFYDSKFKKLLDAAVIYPLKLDWSFADFAYNKESLENVFFIHKCFDERGEIADCTILMKQSEYQGLGTKFEGRVHLGGGDDLFEFKVLENEIIEEGRESEEYTFQFVRQNRAPALDYIERDSCTENDPPYDYLVIPGAEGERGRIDITAFALDPDEDEAIDYKFEADPSLSNEGTGNQFLMDAPLSPGRYNIIATATDEHGASDWQEVRVLVDREMKTEVSLEMPYTVLYKGEIIPYSERFTENNYWVSNEDPVFVTVTIPEESLTGQDPDSVFLSYEEQGIADLINLDEGEQCFNLPWYEDQSYTCSVDDYTLEQFNSPTDFDISPFETAGNGALIFNFAITYCGKNEQSDSKEVQVTVKECVPHINKEHPYPFMPDNEYYKWEFNLDANGETDYGRGYTEIDNFNPFLATHSCCNFNWGLKDQTEVCFENPEPDCYGKINEYTAIPGYDTFILEQELRTCDGERGNICSGQKQYKLWNDELRCGNNNLPGCSEINAACQNQLAWGYADTNADGANDGWCHGRMGCKKFCSDDEVVYTIPAAGPRSFDINSLAKSGEDSEDETLSFKCGCEAEDEGKLCDSNFDGNFNWFCRGGECVPGYGEAPEVGEG